MIYKLNLKQKRILHNLAFFSRIKQCDRNADMGSIFEQIALNCDKESIPFKVQNQVVFIATETNRYIADIITDIESSYIETTF